MKILITGGTGFLGKILVPMLSEHEVVLLRRGDTINTKGVDAIIHLATSYGRAGETEDDVVAANYTLPKQLLETEVPLFINADTFLMPDTFGRNGKYVQTKKDFLAFAQEKIKEKNIKFINLKIEHMYGPYDNPTKIIPVIIKNLKNNLPSMPMPYPKQSRDFVYGEDVARAFCNALQFSETLNQYQEFGIGTGTATTFENLGNLLKQKISSKTEFVWRAELGENEGITSYANLANNAKINWKVEYDLDHGLDKTIKSFLDVG